MKHFLENAAVENVVQAFRYRTEDGDGLYRNFASRATAGLVLFTGGTIRFRYGETETTVQENTVVYLPQGVAYQTLPQTAGDFYLINFTLREPLSQGFAVFKPKDIAPIRQEFLHAVRCDAHRSVGYKALLTGTVYRLIGFLQAEGVQAYLPSYTKQMLQPAIERIEQDFTDPCLTVEALAAGCGISKKYFTALFTTLYSLPPKQYLIRKRLDMACALLYDSPLSVGEIAAKCGFRDIYYFSKLFKKHTGFTPLAYRKSKFL